MLLNKHVDLGALPEVAIKYFTQIHSLWLFCIFATWLACTPTCDRGCTVTKPDDFYLFFDLLPYCNIYTHSRRRQEIEKIERSQGRKERGKGGRYTGKKDRKREPRGSWEKREEKCRVSSFSKIYQTWKGSHVLKWPREAEESTE